MCVVNTNKIQKIPFLWYMHGHAQNFPFHEFGLNSQADIKIPVRVQSVK